MEHNLRADNFSQLTRMGINIWSRIIVDHQRNQDMGGTVSKSNDGMIDFLVRRNSIIDESVELAFRMTDRARFLPAENFNDAYRDNPIKILSSEGGKFYPGPLHISAPEIYAQVVTELDIKPGMSFLNIGSGTGYLSTVVGFLLGESGVNIGLDIYKNLVDFAEENSEATVNLGHAHAFGWCRPKFYCCNGLSDGFINTPNEMYDRIYCGAALNNRKHIDKLVKKLKIGGVLVVPVDPNLFKYTRTGPKTCIKSRMCRSTFAEMVRPDRLYAAPETPPSSFLPSLRELSRIKIRQMLREGIAPENRPKIVSLLSTREESEPTRFRRAYRDSLLRPTPPLPTPVTYNLTLSSLSRENRTLGIAAILARGGDPLTSHLNREIVEQPEYVLYDRFRRMRFVVESENLVIPEEEDDDLLGIVFLGDLGDVEGRSDGQQMSSREVPYQEHQAAAEERRREAAQLAGRPLEEVARFHVRQMINDTAYLNRILNECRISLAEYRMVREVDRQHQRLFGAGSVARARPRLGLQRIALDRPWANQAVRQRRAEVLAGIRDREVAVTAAATAEVAPRPLDELSRRNNIHLEPREVFHRLRRNRIANPIRRAPSREEEESEEEGMDISEDVTRRHVRLRESFHIHYENLRLLHDSSDDDEAPTREISDEPGVASSSSSGSTTPPHNANTDSGEASSSSGTSVTFAVPTTEDVATSSSSSGGTAADAPQQEDENMDVDLSRRAPNRARVEAAMNTRDRILAELLLDPIEPAPMNVLQISSSSSSASSTSSNRADELREEEEMHEMRQNRRIAIRARIHEDMQHFERMMSYGGFRHRLMHNNFREIEEHAFEDDDAMDIGLDVPMRRYRRRVEKRRVEHKKKRESAAKRRKIENQSIDAFFAFFESAIISLPLPQNLKDYLLKQQPVCY